MLMCPHCGEPIAWAVESVTCASDFVLAVLMETYQCDGPSAMRRLLDAGWHGGPTVHRNIAAAAFGAPRNAASGPTTAQVAAATNQPESGALPANAERAAGSPNSSTKPPDQTAVGSKD